MLGDLFWAVSWAFVHLVCAPFWKNGEFLDGFSIFGKHFFVMEKARILCVQVCAQNSRGKQGFWAKHLDRIWAVRRRKAEFGRRYGAAIVDGKHVFVTVVIGESGAQVWWGVGVSTTKTMNDEREMMKAASVVVAQSGQLIGE